MAQTPPEITLESLEGGAFLERINAEFRKVAVNIYDPNTKAEAKRKVKVEVVFEPDERRTHVKLTCNVDFVPAGPEPVKTLAVLGIDHGGTGEATLFSAYQAVPLPMEEPHPNLTALDAKRA